MTSYCEVGGEGKDIIELCDHSILAVSPRCSTAQERSIDFFFTLCLRQGRKDLKHD